MEWDGRRGLKRQYVESRFLNPSNASYDMVDRRPETLAALPHHLQSPAMASDFPHFTSTVYPSDQPGLFYNTLGQPDASKLVLVNNDPLFAPAGHYLPSSGSASGVPAFPQPAGSYLGGLSKPLLPQGNGLLAADDYLVPRDMVLHSNQLAPIDSHDQPLARVGEARRLDKYSELYSRSGLSLSRSLASPQRDRGRSRYSPRRAWSSLGRSSFQKRAKREEVRTGKGATKSEKNKGDEIKKRKFADNDKSKGAESKKVKESKCVESGKENALEADKTKDVKSENPTVEKPVAGMIFGCNDITLKVCQRLKLFGLPASHKDGVLRVVPGTKLFLFNFNSKELSGVFEATCNGAMDIVPDAFKGHGSFPAQVKTKRVAKAANIPLKKFKEAIKENFYSYSKFHYELSASQVAKLLEMFGSKKGGATA